VPARPKANLFRGPLEREDLRSHLSPRSPLYFPHLFTTSPPTLFPPHSPLPSTPLAVENRYRLLKSTSFPTLLPASGEMRLILFPGSVSLTCERLTPFTGVRGCILFLTHFKDYFPALRDVSCFTPARREPLSVLLSSESR